jgi:hypothetical protein
MKAQIEFSLPAEHYEYAMHFHASELFSVCNELVSEFRNDIKHGISDKTLDTPEAVMSYVRSILCPVLDKLDQ